MKTDLIISSIIGFLIGCFFIIVLKGIKVEIPYVIFLPIIFSILSILGMIVALFLKRWMLMIYQVAKFLLVGALNTFVDFGVLNILMLSFGVASGWPYAVFKGFSFSCSVVNSYFWNKFWTFEQKKTGILEKGEFLKFAIVAGTGFVLNVSIASFVVNVIGPQFGLSAEAWGNVGAFVAVLCVFMWNFLGYKLLVFKK